jgi:predicted nuclease of predicted toxin-antitoxin system
VDFVADESVDLPIYERLRKNGHSVLSIAERSPGARDPDVLAFAAQSKAVLITGDTDFGELVFRQGQANAGVLLVRLSGLTAQQKAEVVAMAVEAHGTELPGAFTVVSPGAVRIRHQVKAQ